MSTIYKINEEFKFNTTCFGVFKQEYPLLFSTTRKDIEIYAFNLKDISDEAIIAESLFDNQTHTIDFSDITKIKDDNGVILTLTSYIPITSDVVFNHFTTLDGALTLYNDKFESGNFTSMSVAAGGVINLHDSDGNTFSIDGWYRYGSERTFE